MTLGLPGPLARGARWAERTGMAALDALGATRIPCPDPLVRPLTPWLGFGNNPRPVDVAAVSVLAALRWATTSTTAAAPLSPSTASRP